MNHWYIFDGCLSTVEDPGLSWGWSGIPEISAKTIPEFAAAFWLSINFNFLLEQIKNIEKLAISRIRTITRITTAAVIPPCGGGPYNPSYDAIKMQVY